MNRLNPAFTAVILAVALGGCDNRDMEDDRIEPTAVAGQADAASADRMQSADGMVSDSVAADGTTSNGMTQSGTTQDGMNQNGMTQNGMTPNGMPPGTDPMRTGDMASADRATAAGDASMSANATAAGSADADFYRQALGSGTSEVALSEHALRTSSSAEVKRIAEMLIADHRELNDKLRATSGMGQVPPPPAEAKAGQDIKAKTGAAFDTAYLQKMSEGHKKSIALYTSTSTGAGNAETRRLASAALPKLREHAGHVEKALATVSTKR